uniref:Lipoprotein n=1 Tax=Steinernema glaseri TaxID=37863 RepID=A0A1I7YDN8_9BILA
MKYSLICLSALIALAASCAPISPALS